MLNKLKYEASYYQFETLVECTDNKIKQLRANKDKYLFLNSEDLLKHYLGTTVNEAKGKQPQRNDGIKLTQVIKSFDALEIGDNCVHHICKSFHFRCQSSGK
jgi:hypothetical protein